MRLDEQYSYLYDCEEIIARLKADILEAKERVNCTLYY